MKPKFRALRLVSLIYKIVGWVILVVGVLAAVFTVIIGAIAGRAGAQSPMLMGVPMVNQVGGLFSGLAGGVVVLLATLIMFVVYLAAGELVQLLLSIESNTRETARYLKGESTLPPPPPGPTWTSSGTAGNEE